MNWHKMCYFSPIPYWNNLLLKVSKRYFKLKYILLRFIREMPNSDAIVVKAA